MRRIVDLSGNAARAGALLRTFGWVQVALLVVLACGLVVMPLLSLLPEGLPVVDEVWYPVFIFGLLHAVLFVAVGAALKRRASWAKPIGTALAAYSLLLIPIGTLFGVLALHNLFVGGRNDA
jgi:hypothetical protein